MHSDRSSGSSLYPPLEPYSRGVLAVSGGHRLAYELCGNPAGTPVVVLHGGPGAGCTPLHRRFFDPETYHVILFDQRGAGRSTPYACLRQNTTGHLVADIEALRRHLRIERWMVFGGSWGSTLALVYAATHPAACRALVLRGIWLCRPADLRWWFHGLRQVFPEHWEAFASWVPAAERDDLLGAYGRRLNDPDATVHLPAAAAWSRYEAGCSRLRAAEGEPAAESPRLSLARIEAHYMRHGAFLRPGQIVDSVPRIRHIPAVIVHGRYDMLCPLEGAVRLAEGWPAAELVIVPDAGHAASEPGIARALVAATDRFRPLPQARARRAARRQP